MPRSEFDIIHKLALKRLEGLDPKLTYHCIDHTLDVLKHSTRIANDEGINSRELFLLKVAAVYHDIGFLYKYDGHEEKGCEIFLEDCGRFNLKESEIELILGLIRATKVPQQPKNLLQRIICDADLDYLGRIDFMEIANRLQTEFMNYSIVPNEARWRELQLKFLEGHHYHTNSSRLLREPVKKANIKKIK